MPRTALAAALVLLAAPALAQPVNPAADPLAGMDDATFATEFCSMIEGMANLINTQVVAMAGAGTPLMATPTIRVEGVVFSCEERRMVMHQASTAPATALPADWAATETELWSAPYCGEALFLRAGAAGWTFTRSVTFSDGTVVEIVAQCD